MRRWQNTYWCGYPRQPIPGMLVACSVQSIWAKCMDHACPNGSRPNIIQSKIKIFMFWNSFNCLLFQHVHPIIMALFFVFARFLVLVVSVFQSWCNQFWFWKHLNAINGDHCDMYRSESLCLNSLTKNPWSTVSIPRFKENAKWNDGILLVLWIVELISFAIWFTLCHLRNSTTIEGSTIVSSSMKQMTHPRVDFTMYPWAHWTKRKRQHVSHRRLIRK